MSSLGTNLLFMHGHITDLDLVRRLGEAPAQHDRPTGKRTPPINAAKTARDESQVTLATGACAAM